MIAARSDRKPAFTGASQSAQMMEKVWSSFFWMRALVGISLLLGGVILAPQAQASNPADVAITQLIPAAARMWVGRTYKYLFFGQYVNVYIGPTATGSGSDCSNTLVYTFFNSAGNWGTGNNQIGPDTFVHLCGTTTIANNTVGLTFQASGTSGHPITLTFESGAILQSGFGPPATGAASCGGILCAQGLHDITINSVAAAPSGPGAAGTGGTIQNTANGTAGTYANQQATLLVDMHACLRCTIQNVQLLNAYVRNSTSDVAVNSTAILALLPPGTNGTTDHVTFDYCGWCNYYNWQNGDDTITFSNNLYKHFGHGDAVFGATNAAATNLFMFGNEYQGPGATWDGNGSCPNHQDGTHFFGSTGDSLDGLFYYNNYFWGDWGACPTGAIFAENSVSAGGTSRIMNSHWWNNVVHIQSTGQIENTNGWVNINSGISGTQEFYNNTVVCPGSSTDNTVGIVLQNLSGLKGYNNVTLGCENPIYMTGTTITAWDYQLYGGSQVCAHGGNCYVWNGPTFEGSLANWKTACSCDSHSTQNASPALTSAGIPTGAIAGNNIALTASGSLATLANDTTQGSNLVGIPRPANGGAAWTIGAYQFSPSATLSATTAAFGNQSTGTTSAPIVITVTNNGLSTLNISGKAFTTGTQFAVVATGCTTVAPAAQCSLSFTFTPLSQASLMDTYTITDDANDSPQTIALSGTGTGVASPSCTLTAAPLVIKSGSSSTLTFTPANTPTTCSIDNGVGTVSCSGATPSVSPTTLTTYTATVSNSAGSGTCSATVTIGGTIQGANTIRTANTVMQ